MRKNISYIFLAVIVGTFSGGLFAARADAAGISFRTSASVVHQGQEIAIDVLLDPSGQSVNTARAVVTIPPDLDFVAADDSTSIIGLWVDQPVYASASRTLTFSGIVPGGFSGLIDPFDPARPKPGVLMRLILRGRSPGAGVFSLPEVAAYINDGLGTEVEVSSGTLPIVVDELLAVGSLDFLPDTTAPLTFTPVVERDVLLYDNKRVLIFNTEDKGSGIDHYEVKEGSAPWTTAASPYLLKDQKMKGDILVKAVDRAGNERVEAVPAGNVFAELQIASLTLVFVLLLVLTLVRMSHHVHGIIRKKVGTAHSVRGE